MSFLVSLEKLNKLFVIAIGSVLIIVVGIIDFLTGYEIAFSLFYLIPISLVTWLTGRHFGIVISLLSAIVWFISDVAAGASYSHPLIYAWNTIIILGFFVIVTYLLSSLRRLLDYEKELARRDYLTGAMNSRAFYDLLQTEINRSPEI